MKEMNTAKLRVDVKSVAITVAEKGLLLGTEDRTGYSVLISIQVSDGNTNNLICEDCKNFIIQSLFRALKRDQPEYF